MEGGALVNLGKKDESFSKKELDAIGKLDGVKRIGGFVRNQFPLTLYIWPSGKIGLGAAAKTDLFFESIPDEFLDYIPGNGSGRKLHSYTHHGTKILPRSLEFWTRHRG